MRNKQGETAGEIAVRIKNIGIYLNISETVDDCLEYLKIFWNILEYDVSDKWTNISGTKAAFRNCGNPERSCSRKTIADHHFRF